MTAANASFHSQIQPAVQYEAITPNDSGAHNFRALYVGVEGNVRVLSPNGNTVTFVGVQGILPVQVTRVLSTGTTATDIVGLN